MKPIVNISTYFAHDVKYPRVLAKFDLHLLVAIVNTQDLGPCGPGVVVCSLLRGFRQDLK